MPRKKTGSCFAERVNTHEEWWSHIMHDHSPSYLWEINSNRKMAPPKEQAGGWNWLMTWFSFCTKVITQKGSWDYSWNDHSPFLILKNQFKLQYCPPKGQDTKLKYADDLWWVGDKRGSYQILECKMFSKQQDLVLPKEPSPMSDVGTRFCMTMIPF